MEGKSTFVTAERWIDDVKDKLENLSTNAYKMDRKGKILRENT